MGNTSKQQYGRGLALVPPSQTQALEGKADKRASRLNQQQRKEVIAQFRYAGVRSLALEFRVPSRAVEDVLRDALPTSSPPPYPMRRAA